MMDPYGFHFSLDLRQAMIALSVATVVCFVLAFLAGAEWIPKRRGGAPGRWLGLCLLAACGVLALFFYYIIHKVHGADWGGILLLAFPIIYIVTALIGLLLVLISKPAKKKVAAGEAVPPTGTDAAAVRAEEDDPAQSPVNFENVDINF